MKDDGHWALLKTLPGIAASVWSYVFQMPLEKWVLLATFIHVTLQIFFLLRHAWQKCRGK